MFNKFNKFAPPKQLVKLVLGGGQYKFNKFGPLVKLVLGGGNLLNLYCPPPANTSLASLWGHQFDKP